MSDEMFYFYVPERVIHKAGCDRVPDAEGDDWLGPHTLKRIALDAHTLGPPGAFTACSCVPLEVWRNLVTS